MSEIKLANITELETNLTNIADAIREKNSTNTTYTITQMPDAILWNGWTHDDIASGGPEEEVYLTINPKKWSFEYKNITKLSGTITTSGDYCFENCSKLVEVDLPNYIGGGLFNVLASCQSLRIVKMPSLKRVSTRFFYNDSSLINVNLPSLEEVGTQMFQLCGNLEGFDFLGNSTKSIAIDAWNSTKLNKLIIRGNFLVPLANINAFNGTDFASGKAGGTLYVPEDQINTYKTATNWTTLFGDNRDSGYSNNSIVKIENSAYENYYIDGTEVS